MDGKRIRLPFEDVRLSAAEVAITQTRVFQRLFHLKQLGLAYLVYPNATHTRGAHSIRCLGEAIKILNGLKANGEEVSEEDEITVRITALLHDIGHLPFSHTLEDEHEILRKHDRSARLDRMLDELKHELPDRKVIALVEAAQPILAKISGDDKISDWRSDLVGNTICADLLAYITADAEAAGIEKRSGHYRVYEYFKRHKDGLCISLTKGGIRPDIISAIIDLLDMRFCLTERVFFHHGKCVASAMLARAARLAQLSDADESHLMSLGDEGFLHFLEEKAKAIGEPAAGAERLLYCLQARRLYQRIFKVDRQARDVWDKNRDEHGFCKKWRNASNVETLLRDTEDIHKLPRGSLVLWCPGPRASMKLVEVKVIYETSTGIQGPKALRDIDEFGGSFGSLKERVNSIENIYRDLWTFWVALDRQFALHIPSVVDTLEAKLETECDPVFRDTYLRKIPGMDSRRERFNLVKRVVSEVIPAVSARVADRNGADGNLTEDDVRVTMMNVVTELVPKNIGEGIRESTGMESELPLAGSRKELRQLLLSLGDKFHQPKVKEEWTTNVADILGYLETLPQKQREGDVAFLKEAALNQAELIAANIKGNQIVNLLKRRRHVDPPQSESLFTE